MSREITVECNVHASVRAIYSLEPGETIEQFKKWFEDNVTASIDLSYAEIVTSVMSDIEDIDLEESE